jgi:hypothetical protein
MEWPLYGYDWVACLCYSGCCFCGRTGVCVWVGLVPSRVCVRACVRVRVRGHTPLVCTVPTLLLIIMTNLVCGPLPQMSGVANTHWQCCRWLYCFSC